ncbi:hypothetical protein B7C42_07618 [Nocardia cerradoensis]|uniref:KAP NTPase domain-containing protein n=1 Tax=Nocardia cerradoensis TaxID=85688 RepID=A0A231GUI0_9NOCA|nr:P-loop NTPase fold protein [Nocardia cerradoensis]OXR40280.1 hypothetical protein B7C42_07618 [Nocardia cerradoensis]
MSDVLEDAHGINTDTEITKMANDGLERVPFARRVTDRIRAAGAEQSVVFGLAGPWGSGKSSALNMIAEILNTEHADQWSVAWFTPWSASDHDALTAEFYRAIASAMPDNKQGNKARKLLRSAAPMLSAVVKAAAASVTDKYLGDDAAAKITTAATDAAADTLGELPEPEEDPFSQRFLKLSEAIAAAGRNVLVIVDDVDRLHTDELLTVMKAVRLLGRFDRVHYLLSYDEQTVIDVLVETDLARNNRRRAARYLEKIVQYPFMLPPIQQLHLAEAFRTQIDAVANRYQILSTGEPDADPDYRGVTEAVFALLPSYTLTLRSIGRLCSQVDIMLALVGAAEVDLFDMLLLTYLRLEYRQLYLALPGWRQQLVSTRRRDHSDDRETLEQWTSRVAEAAEVDPTSQDGSLVYKIMASLFPALPKPRRFFVRSRQGKCRLGDDSYFDRYFAHRLPLGDIADEEVRTHLSILARTGTVDANSVFSLCMPDRDRRQLLLGKTLQNLDVIAEVPDPGSCAQAASALTGLLPNESRDYYFTRWGEVIFVFLGHSVSLAEPDHARQLVADHRARHGLDATVDVLFRHIEFPTIDEPKMLHATSVVRQEVLDVCLYDLTHDILAAGSRYSQGVLSFIHCFDADLWARLRTEVARIREEDGTPVYEFAARFVNVMEFSGSGGRSDNEKVVHFEPTTFAELIPAEEWNLDDLPTSTSEDVFEPGTLDHRRAVAIDRLRRALLKMQGAAGA